MDWLFYAVMGLFALMMFWIAFLCSSVSDG